MNQYEDSPKQEPMKRQAHIDYPGYSGEWRHWYMTCHDSKQKKRTHRQRREGRSK